MAVFRAVLAVIPKVRGGIEKAVDFIKKVGSILNYGC